MGDNDHRPITVVIIDDDEIFRDGLEGVLMDTDIEVIGVYGDHEECLRQIADQVMGMRDPVSSHETAPQIQRKCGACADEEINRKVSENEEEDELIQTKQAEGTANKINPGLESGTSNFGSGQPLPPSVAAPDQPSDLWKEAPHPTSTPTIKVRKEP